MMQNGAGGLGSQKKQTAIETCYHFGFYSISNATLFVASEALKWGHKESNPGIHIWIW